MRLSYASRVREAVERLINERPEIAPSTLLASVAAALPAPAGRWLVRFFRAQHWTGQGARVPCQALDAPGIARRLRGPWREIARLALFGPPGQGLSQRDKQREGLYQRLTAEVMREAIDHVTLQAISGRVLAHPDVVSDPILAGMLRSFLSQRESALKSFLTPAEKHAAAEQTSKLRSAFANTAVDEDAGKGALRAFQRLTREFDGLLAQFESQRALAVLTRMRDLRRRFAAYVPAGDLQTREEQYDRLLVRAGTYRRQIQDLASRAATAGQAGDTDTANWVLKRLRAIHMLLPAILPKEELEQLRTQIAHSVRQHEDQEVAQEIMERERRAADRIRRLAGVVHRFHRLSTKLPSTDPVYQHAEANYEQAVAEIRSLDGDWLAGLMLDLDGLFEELGESSDLTHHQLNEFLARVRAALTQLRQEIEAHAAGQPRPPGSRPTVPTEGHAAADP